jgi:adenylate kinase
VRKRLEVYSQQTRPLVDYSNRAGRAAAAPSVGVISGVGSVDDITQRASAAPADQAG